MTCPGCRRRLKDPVEAVLGACRRCVDLTDSEHAEILASITDRRSNPAVAPSHNASKVDP